MHASDDIIESPKPPKPPKAHGPGRTPNFLRQAVAVAAVATAAFTGVTAWETHQERVNTKTFYCSFASDPATNPEEKEFVDQLGC